MEHIAQIAKQRNNILRNTSTCSQNVIRSFSLGLLFEVIGVDILFCYVFLCLVVF